MRIKHFNSLIATLTFLLIISLSTYSCKDKEAIKSSVITEVYEVDNGATDNYAKGSLKYMEHEDYRDDVMVYKTYFNQDQTVKGKDVYQFDTNKKLPSGSKFYGPNGDLLSTYKYTYVDTLKSFAHAYQGDTDELLRIEGFQYDKKGNMIRKVIYNDKKEIQRSFLFGHDVYGNEIKMVMTDATDKEILSETYKIVTVDEQNRWVEKYGYVNENAEPSTFYHKRRSEY